jgi:hypothetical protein
MFGDDDAWPEKEELILLEIACVSLSGGVLPGTMSPYRGGIGDGVLMMYLVEEKCVLLLLCSVMPVFVVRYYVNSLLDWGGGGAGLYVVTIFSIRSA